MCDGNQVVDGLRFVLGRGWCRCYERRMKLATAQRRVPATRKEEATNCIAAFGCYAEDDRIDGGSVWRLSCLIPTESFTFAKGTCRIGISRE
jgi:hypothetical protein